MSAYEQVYAETYGAQAFERRIAALTLSLHRAEARERKQRRRAEHWKQRAMTLAGMKR